MMRILLIGGQSDKLKPQQKEALERRFGPDIHYFSSSTMPQSGGEHLKHCTDVVPNVVVVLREPSPFVEAKDAGFKHLVLDGETFIEGAV